MPSFNAEVAAPAVVHRRGNRPVRCLYQSLPSPPSLDAELAAPAIVRHRAYRPCCHWTQSLPFPPSLDALNDRGDGYLCVE